MKICFRNHYFRHAVGVVNTLILLLCLPGSLFSATYYSRVASGDFATPASWSTSPTGSPTNGTALVNADIFIIQNGHSITFSANRVCAGITINSGGTLISGPGISLTVNGPWVKNGTFTPSSGSVSFGSASAAINAGTDDANFNDVIILSAATLTINHPMTIAGLLTFNAPASSQNGIITIAGSNTLTVAGDVIMNIPVSNSRSTTINVNNGTLTVEGLVDMKSTTGSKRNTIAVIGGTANLNGGFKTGTTAPTIAAACLLSFTGGGAINIGGTISGGAPALTQGTGTVNFKSATTQGIWLETYYNLGVFEGTKSLLGTITVQNQLNIASGTLETGAFNMTLSGSGDAFLCTGTLNPGTGLITMSGASATTIPPVTFNNLVNTNGTKTVASGTTVTVNGNWAQNGPVVLDGTANAHIYGLMSGYGTLTMGSGTLSLDSSYTSSGTFTPGNGTVKYIGNGGAVKVNWIYYNLEIDGNRSLGGAVTVTNVLTVNSGKTFNLAGSPANLTGDGNPVVNNGAITSTTGALVFAGTGSQTIAAGIYPKTTLSNGAKTIASGTSVEIAGAFLVDAALTIEGTGSAIVTGATTGSGSITMQSGTITFKSTFASAGFTPGNSKVIYNGTAAQAVRVGIDYYDLELSSSVSNSIASTTMLIANNFTVESPTTLNSSATLNIGKDLLGSAQFTASGFVNIQGDWLHTGTVIPGTGTIHYNGTNQLVKNFNYYKLSLTGGVKTMEGDITATNLVAISVDTELNMSGYTLELQGPTGNAMTNLGTLTGNGKVWYSLAGAQTVNSSTFYDLEFTGGAKTINTGANIETSNDWIVSSTVTMSSTQNATVGRDLVHNASGFIDQGSGIIRIGRNWVNNGGTFDAAQGTVIYEGANQTIAPFTYNTLTCDGSGTKSITGNILINGILTINPGVTFDRASYTVTLPFNGTPFVNNGDLTGNGKFFYTGTGTQNIASGSYYDLEFTTGQKVLPADESIEILNDWIVASVTTFGNNTIVSVGGSISGAGALTLGNGTLSLAGAWNKTGTFTAANTGIFHYNGGVQDIAELDYYNLQVSNPGNKSLTANTTVRNVMTINTGSFVNLGAYTLNLPLAGTPLINEGALIPGTSTVIYSAVGQTTIAPGDYYNLNSSSGARDLSNGGLYNIGGLFTPGSASYNNVAGSTINLNGTSAQTIPAFTFHKVVLSGSGAKTILAASNVVVYEIEITGSAELDVAGTGQIFIQKP